MIARRDPDESSSQSPPDRPEGQRSAVSGSGDRETSSEAAEEHPKPRSVASGGETKPVPAPTSTMKASISRRLIDHHARTCHEA